MVVIVTVTGVPDEVLLEDFADLVNKWFGDNKQIGTFKVRPGNNGVGKFSLEFETGFDAIEAQDLIDKKKIICPKTRMLYELKAKIPKQDPCAHLIEDQSSPTEIESITEEKVHTEDIRERLGSISSVKSHQMEKPKKSSRKRHTSEASSETSFERRADKESSRKTIDREPSVKRSKRSPDYRELSFNYYDNGKSSHKSHSRDRDYKRLVSKDYRHYGPKDLREKYNEREHKSRRSMSIDKRHVSIPSTSQYDDYKHQNVHTSNYKESRGKHHETNHRSKREEKHKKRSKSTEKEQDSISRSSRYDWTNNTDKKNGPDETKRSDTQKRLLQRVMKISYDEKDILDELMKHVGFDDVPNFMMLQDTDKNIIYEYFRNLVKERIKELKLPNNLELTYVVVDYKLTYNTKNDKNLLNLLSKELSNLGQETVQSLNNEQLSVVIDDVLKKVEIDKLLEEDMDIKPEIKQEDMKTEEEEGELGTINITIKGTKSPHQPPINPPIKTGQIPYQMDPVKIEQIKNVTSTIKLLKPRRFYITVKNILKNMRLHICNHMNELPCDVIVEKIMFVVVKMIENLLVGKTSKLPAREVTLLFRKVYPREKDEELVDKTIKWILEGAFEKEDYLDKLIIPKQALLDIEDGEILDDDDEDSNIEQDNIKKEIEDIKTEPHNETDTTAVPVNIKSEVHDNTAGHVEKIAEQVTVKKEIKTEPHNETEISAAPVNIRSELNDNTKDYVEKIAEQVTVKIKIKTEPHNETETTAVPVNIRSELNDNTKDHVEKMKEPIAQPVTVKQELIVNVEDEDMPEVIAEPANTEIIDISEDDDMSGVIPKPPNLIKTEIINLTDDEDVEIVEPIVEEPELPDITEELEEIDDVIKSCEEYNKSKETEIAHSEVTNPESVDAPMPDGNEKIGQPEKNLQMPTNVENVEETLSVPVGESIAAIKSFLMNQCLENQTTDDLVSSLLG